jgi:hypothetical protein
MGTDWDLEKRDVHFEVRFVPAGTGSAVWDDPHPAGLLRKFMPPGKQHGPMVGIVHFGQARPTPAVVREVVVSLGEDVKAGKYGSFTLFVSSEDEATRSIIGDVAAAKDVALFLCSSAAEFQEAEPAGALTARDRETLNLVLSAGGTVSVAQIASRAGIEQTTAGNRLVSLHRKGYLQRIERPHPVGDLFVDPRSLRIR